MQEEYCRDLMTVEQSIESLEKNVKVGGNLWQHIGELDSKPGGADPGDTQLDNTLFYDEVDFYAAWEELNDYKYALCPMLSKSNTRVDCIKAHDLYVDTAFLCTAVDSNGLCTSRTQFTPKLITFSSSTSGMTTGGY